MAYKYMACISNSIGLGCNGKIEDVTDDLATPLVVGTDYDYAYYGRGGEEIHRHWINLVAVSNNDTFNGTWPNGKGSSTSPSRTHWWNDTNTGFMQIDEPTDLILMPFDQGAGFYDVSRQGDRWGISKFAGQFGTSVDTLWVEAKLPTNTAYGAGTFNPATQWALTYTPHTALSRGDAGSYTDRNTEETDDYFDKLLTFARNDTPGVTFGRIDTGGCFADLYPSLGSGNLSMLDVDDFYGDATHPSDLGYWYMAVVRLYTILGSDADPTDISGTDAAARSYMSALSITAAAIDTMTAQIKAYVDAQASPSAGSVTLTNTDRYELNASHEYADECVALIRPSSVDGIYNLASSLSRADTPGTEGEDAVVPPLLEGDYGEGDLKQDGDIVYLDNNNEGAILCRLDTDLSDSSGLTMAVVFRIRGGDGNHLRPLAGKPSARPQNHANYSQSFLQYGYKADNSEVRGRRSATPTNNSGQSFDLNVWYRGIFTAVAKPGSGNRKIRQFYAPLSQDPTTDTADDWYDEISTTISDVDLDFLSIGHGVDADVALVAVLNDQVAEEADSAATGETKLRAALASLAGSSSTDLGTLASVLGGQLEVTNGNHGSHQWPSPAATSGNHGSHRNIIRNKNDNTL